MTIKPHAASMVSRLWTSVFSGTDLNTSMSKTKDIASTAVIDTASRSLRRAPTSARFVA